MKKILNLKKKVTLIILFLNTLTYSQFVTSGTSTTNNLYSRGNVGIGYTTSPTFGTNKFMVSGNSLFTGNSTITGLGQIANLGLGVAPNTTDRLNVTGNSLFTGNSTITGLGQIANLGLGVAPNTTYRLNVTGNSLFTGNIGIGIAPSSTPSTKLLLYTATNGVSGLQFSNLNNSFVPTTTSNNKSLTVDATGNVILTKSIENITHSLSGNNLTTTINGIVSNAITLPSTSINGYWSLNGNSNATASSFIGTTTTEPLRFRVGNLERLQITNTGRFHVSNTGGGNSNLYFGQNAGNENSTNVSTNTAFGNSALFSVTTGFRNSAFGWSALNSNTTGTYNTASGNSALSLNTSGTHNTASGANALGGNTTGGYNTANGVGALGGNTSSNNNTATGALALFNNGIGNNNTAYGSRAGISLTGSSNVLVGYSSGLGYTSGNNNVFLGPNTQTSYTLASGDNNVFIGSNILPNISNTASNQLNIADKIYGSGTGAGAKIGINVPNPNNALEIKSEFSDASGLRFTNLKASSTFTPNTINRSLTLNTLGDVIFGNSVNSVNHNLLGNTLTTTINGVSSNTITLPSSSSSSNIYNNDGTLIHNRTVSFNDYKLSFISEFNDAFGSVEIDDLGSKSGATSLLKLQKDYGNYQKPNLDGIGVFTTNVYDRYSISPTFTHGLSSSASWMQSSKVTNNSMSEKFPLLINPLGGNVGIGVNSPTAQLHTIKSVRFEDLPFEDIQKINGILGTDDLGNVWNINPNQLSGGSSSGDAWLLNGNAATTPGTESGQNFIGTTDAKDLVFGVNSDEIIRITQTGRLKFFNNSDSPTWYNNIYLGGGNDNISSLSSNINYANVAVGLASLSSNSTGYANTATGYNSLSSNTIGNLNSAFGINTLQNHISGDANVSMGHNSMSYNISGERNTALGDSSLRNIQIGNYNTAIGSRAGFNQTNGSRNIFIGFDVQGPISNTESNQLNIGNWIFGKNGQIAIGSFTNLPQAFITNNDYQLIVKKGVRTEKVRVDIASVKNWADYVFLKDYALMPLNDLENYIKENGHLPNIPKAEEVVKEGVDLGEMNSKLLEKIEELTLHTIELNKKNESQQKLIDDLVQRLEKLEKNNKQ